MSKVYILHTYGRSDFTAFGNIIDTFNSIDDAHQKSMLKMQEIINKYKLDNEDIPNGKLFIKINHIADLKIQIKNDATGDYTIIAIDKKEIH